MTVIFGDFGNFGNFWATFFCACNLSKTPTYCFVEKISKIAKSVIVQGIYASSQRLR
jgi:hypothetical protein